MLNVVSPLPEATERLVEAVIGCAVEVHRALGPGFFEPIYHNAMVIELTAFEIPFESEKRVPIRYRDRLVGMQRLDFVIAAQVIVEIKAVKALEVLHEVQLSQLASTVSSRSNVWWTQPANQAQRIVV
jgi:GxxExxY protein